MGDGECAHALDEGLFSLNLPSGEGLYHHGEQGIAHSMLQRSWWLPYCVVMYRHCPCSQGGSLECCLPSGEGLCLCGKQGIAHFASQRLWQSPHCPPFVFLHFFCICLHVGVVLASTVRLWQLSHDCWEIVFQLGAHGLDCFGSKWHGDVTHWCCWVMVAIP